MLRTLTEEEVKAGNLRRSFLYTSVFTVDNLTAVLMDTNKGGFGLHEETARAKAHAVISWLVTITGIAVPERRQENKPPDTLQYSKAAEELALGMHKERDRF